jgi:alpha-amylase
MNNRTILQSFEWYLSNDGTFWKRVDGAAPSFSCLGFSSVWLPPACKGAGGINDVGYGVYDLYDLGEFDQKGTVRTKYGTKKEYIRAINAVQKEGMKVLADIVLNQKMGGDETETIEAAETDPHDRNKVVSGEETISAWTKFTFPGRKGKYDPFIWDHTCFDGTDWDEKAHRNSIFKFNGTDWDQMVDSENGNYDYLMGCDLDFKQPKVVDEVIRWGKWYFDTTHAEGVRMDALKHIEFTFIEEWIKAMDAYTGKDLFAIGEYWNGDINALTNYLDVNHGCLSLFDVALHFKMNQAASSGGYFDMRTLYDNTLVRVRENNAITFVDNHDTQPGQALQSFVSGWFKPLAYALILSSSHGIPCVFYGDLFGIAHDQQPAVERLPELIAARREAAYGQEIDYFDQADVVGLSRCGDEEHENSGMAVLVSDGPGGMKHMQVSPAFAKKTFVNLLKTEQQTVISDDGSADFSVDGGSAAVYVEAHMAEKIQKKADAFRQGISPYFPW